MTDEQFREQYHPLHVPAHFEAGAPLADHILFALAQLGTGTADEIISKLKELDESLEDKLLIADVHAQLTQWHTQGLLAADEQDGSLVYSLQKITAGNDGAVDPDLLAPGLD
ncbi:hypothetical protein ACFS5N_14750 [Mucilaginibacter ximonensis]|uniref:Uncharacterized protein n=1 Tax=Mucilaginibacter ximonensis TaxID=538021 RepID=A0ABW5YEN2_9SPHI